MTTLSSHVLDTERGTPATGVSLSLSRAGEVLARAATDADGRVRDLGQGELPGGTYQLVFDVAGYLRQQGRPAPFLQTVTIEFAIDPDDAHYHVPLLMTPYACTSYRGS